MCNKVWPDPFTATVASACSVRIILVELCKCFTIAEIKQHDLGLDQSIVLINQKIA